VRGVAYDQDRPVFSSTSSWLLGRNFAEIEGVSLELLELMDGQRSWAEIVESWAQSRQVESDEARSVLGAALRALCEENFVRIRATA
jgi:halogenation protein CepH